MTTIKPAQKPVRPYFSSGPCAKRPGWSLSALENALVARSHRSSEGKKRLADIIERHRKLLDIPADYKIGIVPASDTGAIEMALWSMLGARGVDVFAWESFSSEWLKDVTKQLKIKDVRTFEAGYGALPDLSQADKTRDCVFVWNGTTSGVRVPDGNWIAGDRSGLTFCDATSAVFAYDMPWSKLDVTTWSWQKVIGGEAAHGMIVLSPRAVERLKNFVPDRPLPKIFRMVSKGELIDGIFAGETINTPSMLAVEDCLDALKWVESVGGWRGTQKRCLANAGALGAWVEKTPWVDYLAADPKTRSITSVCLKITDPVFLVLDADAQTSFIKTLTKTLESEHAAYDIGAHRDAPPGLRVWCGATVETDDIQRLTAWLDYAYQIAKGS
jgi:phosphoserine aminotransferase